jgi:hypothetical protein
MRRLVLAKATDDKLSMGAGASQMKQPPIKWRWGEEKRQSSPMIRLGEYSAENGGACQATIGHGMFAPRWPPRRA